MTTDEKLKLITRNLDEVLSEDELRKLVDSGTPLKHYIGFEISGMLHLGNGLELMQKVKDLHDAGAETIIYLADWHTWINHKLDGTLETARRMAKEYLQEAFIAAYLCVDGDPADLNFVLGSDFYADNPDYWATMIEVSQNTTLARMARSITIAGKKEGDSVDFALLVYPAMQAADIFVMQRNIIHAGMDQRKAHVIAKDVALQIKTFPLKDGTGKQIKPVAIHSHLIHGLAKPPVWPIPEDQLDEIKTQLKMSKSKLDSAVFIHDTPEEIKRKVNNAFAPEGEISYNPILDWAKYLIFIDDNASLTINRPEKWGGAVTYALYSELENDYAAKKLHPQDLKVAMTEWIIQKLEPVRKYFEDPKRKAALEEIQSLTTKKA